MSATWSPNNLFFRQVHPNNLDAKTHSPNSVAFMPTPKDENQLSVDDSSLTTAEKAWAHFTKTRGYKSAGTWAVTTGEIQTAGDLDVRAAPVIDPENPILGNAAHCVIDFSRLSSKGQRRKCAQYLALMASSRGCVFQPAS